ncbi:MAG: dimethylsulfoniopropionate demethylase [Pseudomonadota bacterium]
MAEIAVSRRVRRTPFSAGVEAAGVSAYSVYNRMLLPAAFAGLEADYHHLKAAVQVWDVSVERQVEVTGPDADRVMQMLTPRDLTRIAEDQCAYIPVVDCYGGMLNDPVALKVGEDRWWISIADSDLLFWVKGIATGMNLEVRVREPDVSPLAVQGPLAEELMMRVFGSSVQDIRFFRYKRLAFNGRNLVVARSGYSKQGGFEIYVEGGDIGMPLWQALFEAGHNLDVQAGCPNLIERIEGGLLSYGNDMTIENTPFECGLGRYCHLDAGHDFVGRAALEEVAATGPDQLIRPISILGDRLPSPVEIWPLTQDGQPVGQVTSAAWSPDFNVNVSIGMVEAAFWAPGTELEVHTAHGPFQARVEAEFWG